MGEVALVRECMDIACEDEGLDDLYESLPAAFPVLQQNAEGVFELTPEGKKAFQDNFLFVRCISPMRQGK
jgi:hypothetical protein